MGIFLVSWFVVFLMDRRPNCNLQIFLLDSIDRYSCVWTRATRLSVAERGRWMVMMMTMRANKQAHSFWLMCFRLGCKEARKRTCRKTFIWPSPLLWEVVWPPHHSCIDCDSRWHHQTAALISDVVGIFVYVVQRCPPPNMNRCHSFKLRSSN